MRNVHLTVSPTILRRELNTKYTPKDFKDTARVGISSHT